MKTHLIAMLIIHFFFSYVQAQNQSATPFTASCTVVKTESVLEDSSKLGNAFAIENDLFVLNDHSIYENEDNISLTFSNGTHVKAEVIGRDFHTDIALARIIESANDLTIKPCELLSEELNIDSKVSVIGFEKNNLNHSLSTGTIRNNNSKNSDIPGNHSALELNISIHQTQSGSPIFYKNRVIGMIAETELGGQFAYGIKSSQIQEVVEKVISSGSIQRQYSFNSRTQEVLFAGLRFRPPPKDKRPPHEGTSGKVKAAGEFDSAKGFQASIDKLDLFLQKFPSLRSSIANLNPSSITIYAIDGIPLTSYSMLLSEIESCTTGCTITSFLLTIKPETQEPTEALKKGLFHVSQLAEKFKDSPEALELFAQITALLTQAQGNNGSMIQSGNLIETQSTLKEYQNFAERYVLDRRVSHNITGLFTVFYQLKLLSP